LKEKKCYILGIESSCDDTAAAVIYNGSVLSNVVATQKIHEDYGGVVPELASRAHQQNIVPVVEQALRKANIDKKRVKRNSFYQRPWLDGITSCGHLIFKVIGPRP
jgi:N6-L-threonylcarbamoyladenine synthase